MVSGDRRSGDMLSRRGWYLPGPNEPKLGVIPSALVTLARSLLLWVLIPLGSVAWVVGSVWFLRKQISLGQFLGWLDLNLVVALLRGPLRPVVPKPRRGWIPVTGMRTDHRIGLLDSA